MALEAPSCACHARVGSGQVPGRGIRGVCVLHIVATVAGSPGAIRVPQPLAVFLEEGRVAAGHSRLC